MDGRLGNLGPGSVSGSIFYMANRIDRDLYPARCNEQFHLMGGFCECGQLTSKDGGFDCLGFLFSPRACKLPCAKFAKLHPASAIQAHHCGNSTNSLVVSFSHPFDIGFIKVSRDLAAWVPLCHGIKKSGKDTLAAPFGQNMGVQNVEFLIWTVFIYFHSVIGNGSNQLITCKCAEDVDFSCHFWIDKVCLQLQ